MFCYLGTQMGFVTYDNELVAQCIFAARECRILGRKRTRLCHTSVLVTCLCTVS